MPFNPYAPYPNPYGYGGYPSAPTTAPAPSQNVYAFVNGIEGAKSYPMQPNQSVLLMDSDNPIAYMKQSNAMGQATLRYFRLTEVSEADVKGASEPKSDFVTKSDFDALVRRVDELTPKKAKKEE